RGGARSLTGPGREGQALPRQAGPELPPPRGRGPLGGGDLRRLGGEVDVRKDLLGRPASDLHHRPGRQGRPRHSEGVAEDARRRGPRRPGDAARRGLVVGWTNIEGTEALQAVEMTHAADRGPMRPVLIVLCALTLLSGCGGGAASLFPRAPPK